MPGKAASDLKQTMEKGATAAPFYRRERSAYRFLPAFFFPPLAFFAIVCYPPLHVGLLARALTSPLQWLPPGTLTRRRRPSLRGTFRWIAEGRGYACLLKLATSLGVA